VQEKNSAEMREVMFRIPRHIGIIPDGNRRWAKENGLQKEEGYAFGLEPGLKLLQMAKKSGIQELTYYGFTVDNCKRPCEQVKAFSHACIEAVKIAEQENVKIYVLGNTKSSCFPKKLLPYTKREVSGCCDIHAENPKVSVSQIADKMRVNFLINYGWKWDMKNNWASRDIPRVDMVIRWGGMCRLSGFLPIQTVYSDFYIIDDLWPDFKEEQFENALDWYQKQDITLGG